MWKKLKRDLGQFFTRESVWMQPHIRDHLERLSQQYTVCVDPFAGEGDLLKVASKETGIKTIGHDHDAKICQEHGWKENDSIRKPIAEGNAFVLTNPPYLAKNSAKRIGSPMVKYFDSGFVPGIEEGQLKTLDDLYKLAIEKVIQLYDDSIWIVPESVIQDIVKLDEWRDRLHSVTILEKNPFEDTEHPVCVLIFSKSSQSPMIYKNDQPVGEWKEIYAFHQKPSEAQGKKIPMTFNSASGKLGFRAVDGTSKGDEQKIRFVHGEELEYPRERIKVSTRHLTYIDVDLDYNVLTFVIDRANEIIREYRYKTKDVFLTPFMGNNKEHNRRRRLDYRLARAIFNQAFTEITKENGNMPSSPLENSKRNIDFKFDRLGGDPFQLDVVDRHLEQERKKNLMEAKTAAIKREDWIFKRVKNFLERWGDDTPVNTKLEQLANDENELRHFVKDPIKQTFHERYGQSYIKWRKLPLRVLPKRGKSAIYLCEGELVENVLKPDQNATKSIDCIVEANNWTDYISQKWTNGDGGTQKNQQKDVREFIRNANIFVARSTKPVRCIALVDGPYYTPKKLKELRKNINQEVKERVMVMSTYEYVNMVTSERDGK